MKCIGEQRVHCTCISVRKKIKPDVERFKTHLQGLTQSHVSESLQVRHAYLGQKDFVAGRQKNGRFVPSKKKTSRVIERTCTAHFRDNDSTEFESKTQLSTSDRLRKTLAHDIPSTFAVQSILLLKHTTLNFNETVDFTTVQRHVESKEVCRREKERDFKNSSQASTVIVRSNSSARTKLPISKYTIYFIVSLPFASLPAQAQ